MSNPNGPRPAPVPNPRARSYVYAQHGAQGRTMMGDHIINKAAGCDVWKPSWKATQTVIRVFPALCPENPEIWDPWRFPGEGRNFGDWIRSYPVVRNFGDPGVSFILYDPTDTGYDTQLNPAWMIFNAVTQAMAAGQANPAWVPLTLGGNNRGAAIRRPGDITLVQGAILAHGGKEFDVPKGGALNDPTAVIELPPSAASAMLNAMDEEVDGFRGDPDDFVARYVHGDPVSIQGGRFVNFYQMGHDPRVAARANVERRQTFGQARAPESQTRSDERIGYGAYLTAEHRGMPADLTAVESLIRRKVKPWNSVVQILSHEAQIRLLSGALPADMILFALEGTYRDMIPQTVWDSYRAVVHPTTPGAGSTTWGAPTAGPVQPGWGGAAPVGPSVAASGPVAVSVPAAPTGWGAPAPAQAAPAQVAPVQAVAQQRGFGASAPVAPVAPQRGFGAPAPTAAPGAAVVTSGAVPDGELPDGQDGQGAFDPAPTAPTARAPAQSPAAASQVSGSNPVADAIAQSRARVRGPRQS